MWAAGVILYILLCGFPPFRSPERDQDELFNIIQLGHFEFLAPYWDNISDGEIWDFLRQERRDEELGPFLGSDCNASFRSDVSEDRGPYCVRGKELGCRHVGLHPVFPSGFV